TCHSQKPAIISFDSVNGPSMIVGVPPANFTRLACEVGFRPSAASMTPAFTSSSLNLPISVRSFVSGSTPASEFLSPGTITMTRIVLCPPDDTSNDTRPDRHAGRLSETIGEYDQDLPL